MKKTIGTKMLEPALGLHLINCWCCYSLGVLAAFQDIVDLYNLTSVLEHVSMAEMFQR